MDLYNGPVLVTVLSWAVSMGISKTGQDNFPVRIYTAITFFLDLCFAEAE